MDLVGGRPAVMMIRLLPIGGLVTARRRSGETTGHDAEHDVPSALLLKSTRSIFVGKGKNPIISQ